ncbi:MAG: carbohydrate binding family 9 domain-containing protein [Chlorobi bacterium]|nr:carbohydrate binding family 9 domain-containing protein [Chlorobiota bacterium]
MALFSFNSTGQKQWIVPHLEGEIKFDGMPFEEAWNKIKPFPMTMQKPVFGKEPTEKTEIRMTYDDHYIYVSGRFYDRNPAKIQTSTKKRDEFSPNSDGFGILFDNFNDKENALVFMTTPSGTRTDMTIFNDAQGRMDRMPFNMSWNTFWDVETKITDKGWFIEMRIPLSSLRFQTTGNKTVMGVTVWRWLPHLNEYYTYPAIDPKYGDFASLKPSKSQEMVFTDLISRKPLYIAPYVLGGMTRDYNLNEPGTAYVKSDDPQITGGLDVKYGLSGNLTMDLTVNTDFAQVEADDQKVNLTRFSLFFPEKRLFFQERSSIFSFSLGGPSNLFYSRKIGLYKGAPVKIYGGSRIVGRIGHWDMGFLDMQTAQHEDLPSENFGVLRLRRQVFNPYSYLGGILTTRIDINGKYNLVYGLDGIFRIFGDDYVDIKWAQSYVTDSTNNALSLNPSRIRLNWQRRSIKGIGYDFSYSYSGKSFNPGIGFLSREKYYLLFGSVQYGWIPGEESPLFTHRITLRSMNFFSLEDGMLETGRLSLGWNFQTKSNYSGSFSLDYNHERVRGIFELSNDVNVPSGEYDFISFKGLISTPMTNFFYVAGNIEGGPFYDGTRLSFTLQPSWNISSSLNLSGSYQINRVWFPGRNQDYIVHLGGLKLLYMFSTKFSINSFLQFNSLTKSFIGNIRLRYNPREGNDLYIVYNDDLNTGRYSEVPTLPVFNTRTLVLKYTYTFNVQ